MKKLLYLFAAVTLLCACNSRADEWAKDMNEKTVDFTYEVNGLTVEFADITPGAEANIVWDFGDGNTERTYPSREAKHTYSETGSYEVTLDVHWYFTNSYGEVINQSKICTKTIDLK